jgi:flagellar biosynthesis protein
MRKNDEIGSKHKQAVALRYNKSTDSAPHVVAKGTDYIADAILDLGRKHTVPVYQNKALTSLLMAIEIDQEIPPELYAAVAEVLACIYRLDQDFSKRYR